MVVSINLIIDNPNSFVRRQNDDIYVVKLNVHVCLNFHFVNERECIFFYSLWYFPWSNELCKPHGILCSSPGKVVSEEKIFRNPPIRNKNCLWWACVLTNRDEMSNLYRRSSIDASYNVPSVGSSGKAVSEENFLF